jgi:hypothetical protein
MLGDENPKNKHGDSGSVKTFGEKEDKSQLKYTAVAKKKKKNPATTKARQPTGTARKRTSKRKRNSQR